MATNLDPGAASAIGPQVYVHTLATRATQWVSLAALGEPNAVDARSPVLSEFGQFIAFEQTFSTVPPTYSIVFRDLDATTPSFETIIDTGTTPVQDPTMSWDGRWVAFATEAALLPEDTDAVSDVYLRDRQTGELSFLSAQATGGAAALRPRLSLDGQTIAFEVEGGSGSSGTIVTDVEGVQFAVFLGGDRPVIAADGRKVAFRDTWPGVDRIFVDGLLWGPLEEASIDSLGNPTTSDCDDPVISPDGQSVAFRCLGPMTNHGATDQVYVRDLVAGTTKLASINPTGAIANDTDSRPTAMTINGDVLIVEASADNLGTVPGGFPQVFRIPISYWEESGSTCAADDTTCDGVDDDCDGQMDEDYVSQPTVCGVGACGSTGATSCVGGVEQDSCIPLIGAPEGAVCNGIDDDCDGFADEDYVDVPSTCGFGPCESTGLLTCQSGVVVDTCVPGSPGATNDPTCDGVDDDCDGEVDEDCCIAPTCQDLNINCGTVDDGCDGTLDCGGCTGEETCGGAVGFPNVCSVPLPPDPETVAPAGPAGSGSFLDSVSFMTGGPNPVQEGVQPDALDPHRAGLIRGRVRTHSGQPIPATKVTVLGDSSLGSTLTRLDGEYDFLVNGAEKVTLNFDANGYLPVQRTVEIPWADAIEVPDVVLSVQSDIATEVQFGPSAPPQVVEARAYQDADGTRQVKGFIPADTEVLVSVDGQSVPLPNDTGTIRITEYTVGPDGPKAMPAKLPDNTLYTFAVDMSLDEVGPLAKVEFSNVTYFYLDNFLDLPVGSWVPSGYYDFEQAEWLPETDGIVVEVVGVNPQGLAEIDATFFDPQDPLPEDPTGDQPLDAQGLIDLGFTDDERQRLASLYWDPQTQEGASFWRMPIEHLSPWDWNHTGFRLDPPPPEPPGGDGTVDKRCEEVEGSIISCRQRRLSEVVPLAGTPFHLRYDSDRANANAELDRTAVIELPKAGEYPSQSHTMVFRASVLGRTIVDEEIPLPLADETKVVEWDGLDAYGRPWLGAVTLHYTISYQYQEEYRAAVNRAITGLQARDSFGSSICNCNSDPCCICGGGGGGRVGRVINPPGRVDSASSFSFTRTVPLGNAAADIFSFGGWSLSHYHAYDADSRLLIRGDGRRLSTASRSDAARVFVGRNSDGVRGEAAVQLNAEFSDITDPRQLATAPDGSVYFTAAGSGVGAPPQALWKASWQGGISEILGISDHPYRCTDVQDIAVGPGGSIYLACRTYGILKVTERPDGTWSASRLGSDPYQDGSWTNGTSLSQGGIDAYSLAFRDDGTLFFTARQFDRFGFGQLYYGVSNRGYELVEVLPDGRGRIVEAVTANAEGDAVVVTVGRRIAAGTANTIVGYSGGRVRRLFPNGVATTLMNNTGETAGFEWESTETHHTGISTNAFEDIASSPAGDIYLAFTTGACQADWLFQISPGGEIRRLSLEGLPQDYKFQFPLSSCVQSALEQGAGFVEDLAVGPEGRLYATARVLDRIYALGGGATRSDADSAVAEIVSDDGSEVYVFESGVHRATKDAETGADLFTFWHDDEGRLERIDDRDQRSIRIERPDASTIRVVAPPGPGGSPAGEQVTALTLNGEGYLEDVTDPRGAMWSFDYYPSDTHGSGLLERMWDPRANETGLRSGPASHFEYERFDPSDPSARWLLRRDTDATGAQQNITSEQRYHETESTVRADTIFPIMGTWCDGSEYTRGYRIGRTTTRVTHESDLGRVTTYDTSLSSGSPRTLRLTKARSSTLRLKRTDPSGWEVLSQPPDTTNHGWATWPGGSLEYDTTAHPRLGIGAMFPELAALRYAATTAPAEDARPELAQDVRVEFDENNDFTPVLGFPTLTIERVVRTVEPKGTTVAPARQSWVEYTSDPEPKVTMRSAEGRVSSYTLDDRSRIVRVELPGQVPTTYVYDTQAEGFLDRVERQKGGELRRTAFTYDTRGYVNSVQNKVSDSTTDQVTMVNDPVGFATQTTVPGLLSVDSTPDITGALASLTPDSKPTHRLSYTPLGQLAEYASPAGNLSSDGTCEQGTQCWRYSRDRELDEIILADGTTVDYVYNASTGNLDSVTLPGHGLNPTTFGYDLGRRTSATAPTGGTMSFGWQSTLPIRATWSGAHTIPGVAQPVALNGHVERFYNDFLEVERLQVRAGTHLTRMRLVRDQDGLLSRIEDLDQGFPTLTLSRSALDGHVTSTTFDTVTTTHTLDVSATTPGFGDVLGSRACKGSLPPGSCVEGNADLYDASYTYDDRGRIDTWTETVENVGTRTRKFGYDAAGRLVTVHDITGGEPGTLLEEYQYDGNGNREKAFSSYPGFVTLDTELGAGIGCDGGAAGAGGAGGGAGGPTAANDQDQLCEYGGFTYAYNARGQLETKSDGAITTTYTYDGLGRLHQVSEPGLDVRYVHDALGRRIGKLSDRHDGQGLQLDKGWLYADALNPIAQLDSSGDIEAVFLYGSRAHVPDAMVMADGTEYRFITDHVGSVRLVVNAATGQVIQRIDYDAFGRVLQDNNPGFQPFGFAGGLFDDDTGLVRFGARDYDAYAGRWMAKDPILFDGGDQNLYAYVGGDPVNRYDPTGLCPEELLEFLRDFLRGFEGYYEGLGTGAAHLLALNGFLGPEHQLYAESLNLRVGLALLVIGDYPSEALQVATHAVRQRPGLAAGRLAGGIGLSSVTGGPPGLAASVLATYGSAVRAAQDSVRYEDILRGGVLGQ